MEMCRKAPSILNVKAGSQKPALMIFTASLFRLPSDRYAAKLRRTLQASLANGWIGHEPLNTLAVITVSDPTSVTG